MQISTRTEDFIVDTLKLRIHVGPYLREVFKDPAKRKVCIMLIFISQFVTYQLIFFSDKNYNSLGDAWSRSRYHVAPT